MFRHEINWSCCAPMTLEHFRELIETIMQDDSLARHLGDGARKLAETMTATAEQTDIGQGVCQSTGSSAPEVLLLIYKSIIESGPFVFRTTSWSSRMTVLDKDWHA